jgi:hypothetical protein
VDKGVTPELIEKYLHLSTPRPDTLAGLYEHMLESAQSANMKAGVVGGSIGGVGSLRPVLCDFEPALVLEKYRSDWEGVLDVIVTQLKPRGCVPRTPKSIWPIYCRSFSWLSQNRRMSKDYERLCATGEAFVYAAMSRLMVRRLARKPRREVRDA